ncbi:mitochondrial genome maintenance exonuclease 1-like [Oppia nitens]|uniref:mitochondrial genome maintenance exonuclease 1-like n=1 Tax=Oppia nitens TaxID=1686743 RepID=UPI0023DAEDA7|nr:mitochondrial genome maintenance exonuclease 1-like [Oppia nitens]
MLSLKKLPLVVDIFRGNGGKQYKYFTTNVLNDKSLLCHRRRRRSSQARCLHQLIPALNNQLVKTSKKKSNVGITCITRQLATTTTTTTTKTIKAKSKTKTALKNEAQQKLAQIMTNCPIESFPLLKDKQISAKRLEKDLKEFIKCNKQCADHDLADQTYYPSVSTILSSTMSPSSLIALDKWKKLKISQLGEQGFRDYQRNILNRGTHFHHNIKTYLDTKDESILNLTGDIEKLWQSLTPIFTDIKKVELCETPIYHPYLCYKGIVDCVGYYSGKLMIIEWKTSEKLKPSLKDIYDNPLQAVAYLGAINYETDHPLDVKEVVLIYAYEDGTHCQVHQLSSDQCLRYWQQWLSRVKAFWDLLAFKQTIKAN